MSSQLHHQYKSITSNPLLAVNNEENAPKKKKVIFAHGLQKEFIGENGAAVVVREEGAVPQSPPPPPHYLQLQYHFQPHPAPPVFQPRPHYQPQYRLQPHPAPPVFQPRPAPPLLPRPQLPNGMYSNYIRTTMSNFMITGCGNGSVGVPTPFGPQPQAGGGTIATCLLGVKSSATGLQPAVSFPGVASGVRASGKFAETSAFPLDWIGQKRMIDEPREMMTERYKKRIIRNRESAVRSRARKQACKTELEAELLQLKHEKADLGQRFKEIESKYKLQQLEAAKTQAQKKVEEKSKLLRRTFSCPSYINQSIETSTSGTRTMTHSTDNTALHSIFSNG